LFGIALVNMDFFARITAGAMLGSALVSVSDRAVWWIVATFLMFKSYSSLFAMRVAGRRRYATSSVARAACR
jgi:uncharacterized membrane protein YeiB